MEGVCEHCGGTGFIKLGTGEVEPCSCRYGNEDINLVLQVPKRFWEADLENYLCENPSESKALTEARIFAVEFNPEEGKGLTIIGPPGVGKTHLAVGILKKIYREKGIRGAFFDTKDLIYRLKSLIEERKINRAIKRVLNLPLLVLDDLGSERLSDWQRELISYILSYRYNNLKSTIVTTNFPLEGGEGDGLRDKGLKVYLSERIDPGTVSRLMHMTTVIYIAGRDRRKEGLKS
jgi:DNA replication protein DnaC